MIDVEVKIEHVALWVDDLEKMKCFYEKYFNAQSGSIYVNQNKGFKSYFLSFSGGARLELMTKDELIRCSKIEHHYGYSHIALSVGGKENVDKITKVLQNDGFEVVSAPRNTGDGYYESVVLDPENNIIEIC